MNADNGLHSLHLAALMKGKGLVVATFDQERRRKAIALKLRSSPFHNITTRIWDGRHVAGKPGTYDGVLVDAISSGIGSWRRNPDARWTTFAEQIPELVARQLQWLDIGQQRRQAGWNPRLHRRDRNTERNRRGRQHVPRLASRVYIAAVPASSGRREDRRHASALAADSRRRCALYRADDASGDTQEGRIALRTTLNDANPGDLAIRLACRCFRLWPAVGGPGADCRPLGSYRADCGITVQPNRQPASCVVAVGRQNWPARSGSAARAAARSRRWESSAVAGEPAHMLVENADPVTFLLVGSRQAPADRPPGMSVFNVFFDTPATRPFQSYRSQLELKRVRVASQGHRATVAIGDVTIGPFVGELRLTFYRGASLVHVETVVHTQEDRRAILYDTGLALPSASKTRFAWVDTEGKLQREEASPDAIDRHLAVRHRTLIAETASGSVACFPPPHQFFFPRDLTDNLKTVWYGREHRGLDARFGFGIRQSERGGGSFVPWFNAPPGTDQRLGVFYLLSDGRCGARIAGNTALHPRRSLSQAARTITRLPATGTWRPRWRPSRKRAEGCHVTIPDSVRMFKDMGVEIVHLAEFHGDGHPQDPGPLRLPEMEAMFAECKRLSDGETLGLARRGGQHRSGPGPPGQGSRPLAVSFSQAGLLDDEARPRSAVRRGTVRRSGGFITWEMATTWSNSWSAKVAWPGPRTPGSRARAGLPTSSGTSLSTCRDRWLGAAWKAMPADLSLDRLGTRGLDLLDDMANWGQKEVPPRRSRRLQDRPHARALRPHEHQLHPPRARPRAAVRGGLAARAR